MSDNKPLAYDDDDFEVAPSRPRKSSPKFLRLILGVCVFVVILALGTWLMRTQRMNEMRTEAQLMRMEAEYENARVAEMTRDQAAVVKGQHERPPLGPSPDAARKMIPTWLTQGARLIPLGGERNWHWSFARDSFALESEKGPLPDDLTNAFLGNGETASHIEGRWRLEQDNRQLVFFALVIDGKMKPAEVKLWVDPEGPKHVRIGKYQYLIKEVNP